jgi:deoxyribodipyrimidine photo-lyase
LDIGILNTTLVVEQFNNQCLPVSSEVLQVSNIPRTYKIDTVYSHQETGLKVTYERDKKFATF